MKELITYTLYTNDILNEEMQSKLNSLTIELQKSDSFVDSFYELYSLIAPENETVLVRYLGMILKRIDVLKEDVFTLLHRVNHYSVAFLLWGKLNHQEKYEYLVNTKEWDSIDYQLIQKNISSKKSKLFRLLLGDSAFLKRIDAHSLEPNLSLLDASYLENTNYLRVLKKEVISKLVLTYLGNYYSFKEYYETHNFIIDYLEEFSLSFRHLDSEDFNTFLLKNPKFLIYCNPSILYTIQEDTLVNLSKIASSELVAKEFLLMKNPNYMKDYFTKEYLLTVPDHFIQVFPFRFMSLEEVHVFINDYELLKKLSYPTLLLLYQNYASMEEKIDLLRNTTFLEEIPSKYLEKYLNLMNFQSIFNFLQNKTLFDKIHELQVPVVERDQLLVDSFLESPYYVYKATHTFIYQLLRISPKLKEFIQLPYLYTRLTAYSYIELLVQAKLDYFTLSSKKELNSNELRYYLDQYFLSNGINYDVLFHPEVLELMGCSSLKEEEYPTLQYLFDKIITRGKVTTKCYFVDYQSVRSVLVAYLLLGFDLMNTLYTTGNQVLTITSLKKLEHQISESLVTSYTKSDIETTCSLLKDLLDEFKDSCEDPSTLEKLIKQNHSLPILLKDMTYSNINSLDDLYQVFSVYYDYYQYSVKDASRYLERFVESIYRNKKQVQESFYQDRFYQKIHEHFYLREDVLQSIAESHQKEIMYPIYQKMLTNLLTGKKEDTLYTMSYSKVMDDLSTILLGHEEECISYLKGESLTSILNTNGFVEPNLYQTYLQVLKEEKLVNQWNTKLKKLFKGMHQEYRIYLLNHICYHSLLPMDLEVKQLEMIESMQEEMKSFNGKVDVDKSNGILVYSPMIQFIHLKEILAYQKQLTQLENTFKKAITFVKENSKVEEVQSKYRDAYEKNLQELASQIHLSDNQYKLEGRSMTMDDFKKVFSQIKDIEILSDRSKKRLLTYVPYLIDGYFDDIVNHYGLFVYQILHEDKDLFRL